MLTLETYFDEAGEHLLDPTLLQLQFIQAVYQVISGRYPTTADQAIELGAIHFLHKFGEYKPSTHVPGEQFPLHDFHPLVVLFHY